MNTKIVILAAGMGTRMGADVPKALVEIAGQPMIEHLLGNISEAEIDYQPVIVVAPHMLEAFGEVCRDSRCEFAIQEKQLGTGHATMSAQNACHGAESVIVLYGDHPFISSEVLATLAKLHEESDSVISMLTTKVPNFKKQFEGFKSWGRIVRDSSGRIEKIVEAKDASEVELEIKELNPAIYMFEAEWLWEHLPELENKNAGGEYYLTDLIGIAIEEGENVVTTTAEPLEVIGINTPEELERAENLLG